MWGTPETRATWRSFSFVDKLGNIGVELHRVRRYNKEGKLEWRAKALERTKIMLEWTLEDVSEGVPERPFAVEIHSVVGRWLAGTPIEEVRISSYVERCTELVLVDRGG